MMPTEHLLAELAKAGFPVESIDELRESGKRYSNAVPVLVDGLRDAGDAREKQSIVRALSVPWARSQALVPLIDEFRSLPVGATPQIESLRWAIGNALEVLWDDSAYADLVGLAVDRRFGKAREMVVLGMGRSRRPEVADVLIELLDDFEVSGHAVKALAKLKLDNARPALERMTADPRSWVRRAAEAGLKKLS